MTERERRKQMAIWDNNIPLMHLAANMIDSKMRETVWFGLDETFNNIEKFSKTLPWKTQKKAMERLRHFRVLVVDIKLRVMCLMEKDIFSDDDLCHIVAGEYEKLTIDLHKSFGIASNLRLEMVAESFRDIVEEIRKIFEERPDYIGIYKEKGAEPFFDG